MLSVEVTLAVMGAAEGSWYSVPGSSKDVRYSASFANSNSGLSFGVFQFDVATNGAGQVGFREILKIGVDNKVIDQTSADRIFVEAATRNARAKLSQNDVQLANSALKVLLSRAIVDRLDRARAVTEATNVGQMISRAATRWSAKGIAVGPVLTDKSKENITLSA